MLGGRKTLAHRRCGVGAGGRGWRLHYGGWRLAPYGLNGGQPQDFKSVVKRFKGVLALLIIGSVVIGVGLGIPMPFVISKPGPTFDVTGSVSGYPVIDIHNDEAVTASQGQLRMVTVSTYGGTGSHVSLFQVVQALLLDSMDVERESDVYPSDLTREELDQMAMTQMTTSQSTAAAVALEELGYNVTATFTIAGAVTGSHAEGSCRKGRACCDHDSGWGSPQGGQALCAFRFAEGPGARNSRDPRNLA